MDLLGLAYWAETSIKLGVALIVIPQPHSCWATCSC